MPLSLTATSTVALVGPVPASDKAAVVGAKSTFVEATLASTGLLKAGAFTHVIVAVPAGATVDSHLGSIKAALAPGGTLTLTDASGVPPANIALALMMQDLAVTDPAPGPDGTFTITATLPTGSEPTVMPVKRAAPAPSAAAAWGVVDGATDALVDEDALLAGDDAGEGIKASGDCSTKPRACANCSCGRAEAEAAADTVTLSEEQLQAFTSSCGNCSKGDAFRCASCPHRGKPAFKPGMEGVVLDLGGDDLGAPIMVG